MGTLSALVDNAESCDDLIFSVLNFSDEHVYGKLFMICWSIWKQKLWQNTVVSHSFAVFERWNFFVNGLVHEIWVLQPLITLIELDLA